MRLGVARIQAWPHAWPRSTITYLAHPARPRARARTPSSAPRQTAAALTVFGAFSDCAPDRWGRRLVQRAEHDRAAADTTPSAASARWTSCVASATTCRQGALRFRDPDSTVFLADEHNGVPALMDLGHLLLAADHLDRDQASHEDVRRQLARRRPAQSPRPRRQQQDRHREIRQPVLRQVGCHALGSCLPDARPPGAHQRP